MMSMPTARPDGTARSAVLASLALATGLRFTCRITSPGCSTRAAGLSGSISVTIAPRVFAGSSNCRDISGVTLLSVMPNPAPVSPPGAPASACTGRFGVEAELLDFHVERPLLAVPNHFHRHRCTRRRRRYDLRQIVAARHRLAVEFHDDVAGFDARRRRRSGRHLRDDGAAPILQAERINLVRRHGTHRDADAAARDLARPQSGQHVAERVDGNREADADVAGAAAHPPPLL